VWYEIVPPETPLTQGDIVEACPVLTFDRAPEVPNPAAQEAIEDAVQEAAVVQFSRVIVMTQACDIEQSNVRQVILCPGYHVEAWRNSGNG